VILNSIFGFGGKVNRGGFETCSSHLSPRNGSMNTSFRIHILHINTHHVAPLLNMEMSNEGHRAWVAKKILCHSTSSR
jgi:hypothetical protein